MTLWRVRWHSSDGSDTPVDRVLDAAEAAISEGVREMACRLARNAHSFEAAAQILLRMAHLSLSKESLRQLVEGEGRAVIDAVHRDLLKPAWQASDCRASSDSSAPSPTRVYLGCDGVKVPMVTEAEKAKRRKKVREKRRRSGRRRRPLARRKTGADQAFKEFRIVVAYDEHQTHRFVVGTHGDCAEAGRCLQRLATQIQLRQADEKIANIDGAPWIRNQLEFYGLVDAIGLDYFHLRDYVQKTRRAIFGDDECESKESRPAAHAAETGSGAAWVQTVMGVFYEQGGQAGWEYLQEWRKSLRGSKRGAADRLLKYVAERLEMIRYPQFRVRGWQIGSGPTEAHCKTSTSRLKGRGRRWDPDHAEAMMALDCLETSRLWSAYWATQYAA